MGEEGGDYWNREGTKRGTTTEFPTTGDTWGPGSHGSAGGSGWEAEMRGGRAQAYHQRHSRDCTSEANLKGSLVGRCPIVPGNCDNLQRLSR